MPAEHARRAGVEAQAQSEHRLARTFLPDLVLTLAIIVLFVWVMQQALAWPFKTSLFPVLNGSVVLLFAVLKLGLDLRRLRTARSAEVRTAAVRKTALVEEEQQSEAEMEGVFTTATPRTWGTALGWMALFFALLWLLGMLITVPVFALLYLLLVSRERLPLAGAYAVLAWLFIYGLFDQVLHVPLPNGVLTGAIGL